MARGCEWRESYTHPCSTSSPSPETAHEPPPSSTTKGHSESASRAPFWPLRSASAVACADVAAAPGRLGMPLRLEGVQSVLVHLFQCEGVPAVAGELRFPCPARMYRDVSPSYPPPCSAPAVVVGSRDVGWREVEPASLSHTKGSVA